jgi:hypothetical protein
MPYSIAAVSITSATVPVSIMPPTTKTAWLMRVRSSAAVSVLVFPYSGSLPGAAPAGVLELAAGQNLADADAIGTLMTDSMQQGWAAVLETGSVAVAVDALWRP